MNGRAQARMLPDGRRLHLQDGPIDLVIEVFGPDEAVAAAYRAAILAFDGLLDALCGELPLLRAEAQAAFASEEGSVLLPLPGDGVDAQRRRMGSEGWRHATPSVSAFGLATFTGQGKADGASSRDGSTAQGGLRGPVARRMAAAVASFAGETFITPMAAVAGAVADHILAAIVGDPRITRAYVNNGGDIAVHVAPGERLRVGLVDRPDRPSLLGHVAIESRDGIGGVATSGWRGRSFSLGIADSVTVLARSAAEADAAATVVANAVDLPGHPAVARRPADSIAPDSDLGDRPVTRDVGPLTETEIATALAAGLARAEDLLARGLILGAALQMQGRVVTTREFSRISPNEAPSSFPFQGKVTRRDGATDGVMRCGAPLLSPPASLRSAPSPDRGGMTLSDRPRHDVPEPVHA